MVSVFERVGGGEGSGGDKGKQAVYSLLFLSVCVCPFCLQAASASCSVSVWRRGVCARPILLAL